MVILMGEWNKVKLSEIASFTTGKLNSNAAVELGKYPFFTCSPETLRIDDYAFDQEAILLAGNNAEGNFNIKYYEGRFNAYQRTYVFSAKDNCDLRFLYYSLKLCLGNFKRISQGTATKFLTAKILNSFELMLPDLEVQHQIADILSMIDNKIELNTEINDNLAEQAQAFLCHFMEQYQYQLKPLSDIADVIDCLHSKKPAAVDNSSYQLIQLDNIRDDGFLDMSACKYMISQADYENWTRKCEIIEGDCVITNVGRIGAVSQAPFGTKAAMGRNMTCIRLKSGQKLQAYFITVLLSNHMRRQIQYNTDEGTIMGALNVKNIPKLLFPIFDSSNMSELENILYPLRKQIEYNNLQNQSLSQLRDTLLPKLMSGELDVSELAF